MATGAKQVKVGRARRMARFLTDGIWDVDLRSLTPRRRFGTNILRVINLVVKGYWDDECPLHAAALTFNTMMSIVPVLALSLSIAKGFGAGDFVKERISRLVHTQLEQLQKAPIPMVGGGGAHVSDPVVGGGGSHASPPGAVTPPAVVTPKVQTRDAEGRLAPEAALPLSAESAAVLEVEVKSDASLLADVAVLADAVVLADPVDADPVAVVPAAAGDPTIVPPEVVLTEENESIVVRIDSVVAQIFSYAERINFAALGGLGLLLLLWSVISVLGRVEFSFNRVWGLTAERSLLRKFTDYLGVLILTPFLIMLSSSLPLIDVAARMVPGEAGVLLSSLVHSDALKHVTVIALVSLSMAVFLMIMPNTRVRFGPALWGGVIAGLLFIGWLWVCVQLEVGALRAGKIYGSFAVLPILLMWVLTSWQIVLLGAEVAFAVQNCSTYRLEKTARHASTESRIILALSIIGEASERMKAGEGPFDAPAFTSRNRVPVRLLNAVLLELCEASFLAEIANADGLYALLRAPDDIQKRDIVAAMMKSGADPLALGLDRLKAASEKLLPEG